MFSKIIKECRSLIEAGGYNITRVPSAHLAAAADTLGSDPTKHPEVLVKAIRKKSMAATGVNGVQSTARLARRKAAPPPIPADARVHGQASADTKAALADLPRRKAPPIPKDARMRAQGSSDTRAALADLPRRRTESRLIRRDARKPLP